MKASVRLVPLSECRSLYERAYFSSTLGQASGMICAGAPDGDACAGDGGGPLVLRGAGDLESASSNSGEASRALS